MKAVDMNLPDYDAKRCEHVMANEKQCGMYKNSGIDMCWVHRTDLSLEDRLARKRKKMEPPKLTSNKELLSYATQQMHRFETGEMDAQAASVMKDFIGLCFKILDKTDEGEGASAASIIASALLDDDEPAEA